MLIRIRVLLICLCLCILSTNNPLHAQSKEKLIETLYNQLETQPDFAFLQADSLLQHTDSLKFPFFIAEMHELLGRVLFQRGVHYEALQHYLLAKNYWEKVGNALRNAKTLISIGEIYYYVKQPDLSKEAYSEALAIFERLNTAQGIGTALNHLAHLAEKQGYLKEAAALQEKALSNFTKIDDKEGIALVLEGLGSVYEDEGNYERAGQYFYKAYQMHEENGDLYASISTLNNLGDSYRKQGNLKLATKYTQLAIDRADSLGAKYQKSSALRDMAKINFELGDYKNAYKLLEEHRLAYASIYKEESNQQINMLQALYANSKKDRLIQSLKRNEQMNRFIAIGSVCFLLLTSVIVYLSIKKQRLKLSRDQKAIQLEREQYESAQKLSNIELENARLAEQKLLSELEVNKLSEQILHQELEQKSRELTSHTLQIIRKTKLLAELKEKLKEVHGSIPAGSPKKTVKELLAKLDMSMIQEKEWGLFQKVFEEVHEGFFDTLKQKHGDLSVAEKRLCALIKLNLTQRDIALSLGISTDSLRIARYRLKKRLDLTAEQKLSIYLQNISEPSRALSVS